jgi:hypothetical protein
MASLAGAPLKVAGGDLRGLRLGERGALPVAIEAIADMERPHGFAEK